MQNIGDLSFKKIDEANFEYSIKILENCLNTGGIAHGGFIATIAILEWEMQPILQQEIKDV